MWVYQWDSDSIENTNSLSNPLLVPDERLSVQLPNPLLLPPPPSIYDT